MVRRFEASDAEPVEVLLEQIWKREPMMLRVYSVHRAWPPGGPPIRETLVATVAGEVHGAATLIESTLHPKMLWAAVNVAPRWQRRGLGSALYDALCSLSDGRPWLVKLTLRDEAGTSFLEKRGFYSPRSVRSIMGVLDPRKESVRQWLERLPRDVPGYTFLSLGDPENPATLRDVARVQAAVYRQYHAWNLPTEEPLGSALAHYCGPNVLAGSNLCVFEGATLIGAANLFRHPLGSEGGEAYLAHIGVVGKEGLQVQELTAALIRRSLEWAGAAGFRVRFEADEAYAPHHALYQSAPADSVDRDFAIYINA
jgi:GNAT superfamily N-acetyltransferase